MTLVNCNALHPVGVQPRSDVVSTHRMDLLGARLSTEDRVTGLAIAKPSSLEEADTCGVPNVRDAENALYARQAKEEFQGFADCFRSDAAALSGRGESKADFPGESVSGEKETDVSDQLIAVWVSDTELNPSVRREQRRIVHHGEKRGRFFVGHD